MSLETIYKAVRVLHWLRAMQRKDEPAYYPYIQRHCRQILEGYELALQPVEKDSKPKTIPAGEG